MCAAWRTRPPVEAWVVGGSSSNEGRDMGSVQDLDGDSDLTKRRIWQRTHLKLVDKPLAMDSEQTVPRETSPVNNVTEQHVDTGAGGLSWCS